MKTVFLSALLLVFGLNTINADSVVEDALMSDTTYNIVGIFGQHDFTDASTAFDWAFTTNDGTSYQLQGSKATEDDVFGWKKVNVVTPVPAWYMFQLNGDVDGDGTKKFDWILASTDMDNKAVYKLAGVSDSGNFEYSTKLNVDYRVSGNSIETGSAGWIEASKVLANDGADRDQFGSSVAIDGDYAVVGAFWEDEDASGENTLNAAGSAYIFVRNGTTWSFQQKLVASDRAAGDLFGISVAISGNTVIIGAFWENEDASGGNTLYAAGSAYIFVRNGTIWNEQQKLVASDRGTEDLFGHSVAISSDTVIVGASGEAEDASGENTLNAAGSAYIFARNGTIWNEQQKLIASDRGAEDLFGHSVAISGDTVIVGASRETEDASGENTLNAAGSAYIFVRNGTIWNEQQKFVPSDRGISDHFGNSVSISGDTVIVGASGEAEDASGGNTLYAAGSAYIFVRNGTIWNEQQKLVASHRSEFDLFGTSVSISGDTVIVGAYNDDDDASGMSSLSNAGSAYIFEHSGTTWSFQQKLVASDRAVENLFGHSVSISGDTVIVGAPGDTEDKSAAYLFSKEKGAR